MDTYHRWMECTIYATLAGLPAISLPAGFHASQPWPMGIQLIGRPQGDVALLQVAASHKALVTVVEGCLDNTHKTGSTVLLPKDADGLAATVATKVLQITIPGGG
jgi:hypothetical protein